MNYSAGPIDMGATVNAMDKSTFDKLRTCPYARHMNAKIYPYGSSKPLAPRAVIYATVGSGTEEIRMTFNVSEGETRTSLGCSTSKAL